MRLFSFSMAILLALTVLAPIDSSYAARKSPRSVVSRVPVKNTRYAALIMDEDTGAILHQENAYDQRFPASLTKMMTLYLLFEALKKGKVSMNTEMTASAYAAGQPQTNLSLHAGDKIPVETAIKALVIRSANDVAVVVGEHLGGTASNFGTMMTAKAKMLGMNNTLFRNPNGLPDPLQHTSAYDMAVLGKALKHDFPQYYPYFNTRSFSFHGVNYLTHNNILARYNGTDGIKTGYIRASGFNLVTSVNRHGHKLIGVVMGGVTARSRDDQMIALLNRTYAQLNDKTGRAFADATPAPMQAPIPAVKPAMSTPALTSADASVPPVTNIVPVAKPAAPLVAAVEKAVAAPVVAAVAPVVAEKQVAEAKAAPAAGPRFVAGFNDSPAADAPAAPSLSVNFTPVSYQEPEKPAPQPNTLEYQLAMMMKKQSNTKAETATLSARLPAASAKDTVKDKAWGIQVGAYNDEKQARAAVQKAFSVAKEDLQDAYITISEQATDSRVVHRARLGNLSREEANAACAKLKAHQTTCFALPIQ